MYLSFATRPDITFAVHFVSQVVPKPIYHHWEIVERIHKYLWGTLDYYGIVCEPGECYSRTFSDLNNVGDFFNRQKQRSVSLSTMEVEYIAGSEADGGGVHSWK
ncbi:hypothetical protein JTB14_029129 [Gonioctena quinquepunctata]|nr:hypothetical protein JTB14_029129 [Gonioctena quinquepunctata]